MYRENITYLGGKNQQKPTNEIEIGANPDAFKKNDNMMVLMGPHEVRYIRAGLINKINLRSGLKEEPSSVNLRAN